MVNFRKVYFKIAQQVLFAGAVLRQRLICYGSAGKHIYIGSYRLTKTKKIV